MDLNWFESFLFGLFSGLADILPISAEAHRILMLKFFGIKSDNTLLTFFVHLAVFGALYFSCQKQIVRMSRAQALKRVPKRRRRRPLDVRSLMDLSLLITILVPVIISLFLRGYASKLGDKLMWIAIFLFVNGLILYIPQFLPTGNRDSRTLSRVEGLLMGLGGALGILPGISATGAALSVGSVCGVDRSYSLTMVLLMDLCIHAGFLVLDVMALLAGELGTLSFMILIRYIFAAAVAFAGAYLGIRLMRHLAANNGFTLFAFYCWGVSLFTFILNLMA